MRLNQNRSPRVTAFSFIELALVLAIIGGIFGIILGSQSIIRASKLSSARSLTKSSPVAEIENLSLWLESTSADSFDDANLANNTSVSNWYDINPKAITVNDVTQNTTLNRPTFVRDGINGIPVVRFDGNDYLRNANPKLPTENNERTLFIVVGNGTNNSDWDFAFHYGVNSALQSFDVGIFDNIGDSTTGIGIHLSFNDYSISTENGANSKIISITYKYTTGGTLASNMQVYINGQYKAADAGRNVNSNLILNTPSTDLVIGAGSLGGSDFVKADIGEIIMFNRMLTNDERQSVENYLSSKWHIKLN